MTSHAGLEDSYSAFSVHLRRPRLAVTKAHTKRREADSKQAALGLLIQQLPINGTPNFSTTSKRYSLDSNLRQSNEFQTLTASNACLHVQFTRATHARLWIQFR